MFRSEWIGVKRTLVIDQADETIPDRFGIAAKLQMIGSGRSEKTKAFLLLKGPMKAHDLSWSSEPESSS